METDLTLFGYRELVLAGEILAWFNNHSYPEGFEVSGVCLAFNPSSGNVYMTNDEGQVLQMVDGKLELAEVEND